MPLRLPRFRLRTLLIAMVLLGLVLSRCRVVSDEPGLIIWIRGSSPASLVFWWPTRPVRDHLRKAGFDVPTLGYNDRSGNWHKPSALFSFKECHCCGQSWEWDGERYVE